MKVLKRNFLPFVFLLVVVLYFPFLRAYFSQDDFFHFKIARASFDLGSFSNIFAFKPFADRGGIYFYRPVFREGLYWLYQHLFGIEPLPFRLTQLLIHFLNIILVYRLIQKLTASDFLAKLAALFFALSAVNLAIFNYLAGGIQVSGATLFVLLTVYLFHKCLITGKRKYYTLSLMSFVVALGSHELSLVTPLMLLGLIIVKKGGRKIVFQTAKKLLPFFIPALILIWTEGSIIGLPISEKPYQFIFNPFKIANSYFWYFVWALGLPEMLVDFVGPGFKLNPNLMKYWGNYFYFIFPLFGLILIFLAISLKDLLKKRLFWFFGFWFFLTIGMMVFLPFHRQVYYLAPSLPAISALLAMSLGEVFKRKRILGLTFLVIFLSLNVFSIKLGEKTYWTVGRSRVARNLITDIKNVYPVLPKGAVIYYLNDENYPKISEDWKGSSTQAFMALSGSDALQIIYKDLSIRVYYEDISPPPDKVYLEQKAVIN